MQLRQQLLGGDRGGQACDRSLREPAAACAVTQPLELLGCAAHKSAQERGARAVAGSSAANTSAPGLRHICAGTCASLLRSSCEDERASGVVGRYGCHFTGLCSASTRSRATDSTWTPFSSFQCRCAGTDSVPHSAFTRHASFSHARHARRLWCAVVGATPRRLWCSKSHDIRCTWRSWRSVLRQPPKRPCC